MEKLAIVSNISVPKLPFVCSIVASGEFPLHEVSILVLNGFMKHPTLSPFRLSVLQRN